MLKIKKNAIYITRGDSAYITVDIYDGSGNLIVPEDGDHVRCQVRDEVNDGTLLFEGTVLENPVTDDDGTEHMQIIWYIRPQDTRNADMTKSYVYDMQIEFENGDVFTFIQAARFNILDEVTLPLGYEG